MIKVLLAVCRTLLARLSLEVEGYAQGPSPGLPHSLLHRSRMPGALHRGATKQKSPGNLGAIFYLDLEFGAETLISGPHSCGCQKPREATSGLRKACKPQGWGLGQRGVLSSTRLSWTAPGGRHNQSATPSKLLGYVERGRIPTASRTNIFLHRILIDIHSFSKQMQPRRE